MVHVPWEGAPSGAPTPPGRSPGGKKSPTPNGSSSDAKRSSRSGLMEGEFGKVSAGPTPPIAVAEEPGLWWWLLPLRLAEVHLPLDSPEALFRTTQRMPHPKERTSGRNFGTCYNK